jgi:hypothetical protein
MSDAKMPDASTMKEKASQAQEQVASTAQDRVREQVDQRSTQAGEQVSATAHAFRSTSDRLREEGQDAPAKVAEQIAGRAERVGDYLKESDGERILHDVEDFGRRQPMAVVGLGLLAGLAASRLLRASSRRRYDRRDVGARAGTPSQRPALPDTATDRQPAPAVGAPVASP